MISISFDGFFSLCGVLVMAAVMAAWIQDSWRVSAHGWEMSRERVCQCRGCGVVFLVRRTETAARCPECGGLVRARERKSAGRMKY